MSQNKEAKLKFNMDSLETKKATKKRFGTCAKCLVLSSEHCFKTKMTFYTNFKKLCYTNGYILKNIVI